MFLQRGASAVRQQWRLYRRLKLLSPAAPILASAVRSRGFHTTASLKVVKPVLLADIGEGMAGISYLLPYDLVSNN